MIRKIWVSRQSWEHLAFVQSRILHESGQKLGVVADKRFPFLACFRVPEHEATLLRLNPTSNDGF